MSKRKRSSPKQRNEGLEKQQENLPTTFKKHTRELKMKRRFKQTGMLSEGELRFYSRQVMLDAMGIEGQLALKESHVAVIGLGGLGSTSAMQLASMGVGHIRLIDRDVVEESNLQRQHLYSFDLLGFPKVEAARKRLKTLNPYIELKPLPFSLNEDNAEDLLSGVDAVVDGLDNMNARYAANRACVRLEIPYVFGSAIATYGNVSTILPRKTACLECFYGKLDDNLLPTCAAVGVHPSVLGVIASIQVSEVIRIILGKPPSLKNKLIYCDISSVRFEEILVKRSRSCPACGSGSQAAPSQTRHEMIREACGRDNKRVFIVVPRRRLNLDMERLIRLLSLESTRFVAKAELGVTYKTKEGAKASILKSGVMIVEGLESRNATQEFYEATLGKMGIAPSSLV
jgi:adenylyltransferase/sulfurtransferase